ncbi:hypothetical protein NC653_037522 [Populus alba x Populus x berolinensis]|uniref:Uncharacterized protein n=1 Tax=Populus alba x Populus x berolinensis TaxID=444605 RepID=A0AAD6LEJ3_9ROSI|nr:hypothetical protein NC653_037522 [Populus alba x Populus x berolinensis]
MDMLLVFQEADPARGALVKAVDSTPALQTMRKSTIHHKTAEEKAAGREKKREQEQS